MQTLKEYQGFPVNLKDISKMLVLISNNIASNQELMAESGFGDNKVRGVLEYLKDFNLLKDRKSLTELGSLIHKNDKRFSENFTRWIILYQWAKLENNPILYYLVNELITGKEIEVVKENFIFWANKFQIKTDYDKNFISGLLNKTINSIVDSNSDAFQNLNLFTKNQDKIIRAEPYAIHPLFLGYIVYENRNGRTSIGIDELLNEVGNIGKFFGLNSKELDNKIVEMMNIGIVRMIQHADLHMIEFIYKGSAINLLEKYYDEN
ncbi:hypothetical protein GCM10027035_23060 [Emticicia sediminis]